jgi:stress response protein SCP2
LGSCGDAISQDKRRSKYSKMEWKKGRPRKKRIKINEKRMKQKVFYLVVVVEVERQNNF